jgi:transposase-like protein
VDDNRADDLSVPQKRRRWSRNDEDVKNWSELFQSGITIVHIAEKYHVDPNTVSHELHALGLTIKQGHHMVQQLPLRYSPEFIQLIDRGPDAVLEFVKNLVWGISATDQGTRQVRAFCEFFQLHHQGVGVKEIARRLSLHRSSVAEWREGTDQPYLIRAARDTLSIQPTDGWKLLPMHLTSGGSEPSGWIQVPQVIRSYDDILGVISQVQPLQQAYDRAKFFGLPSAQVMTMRPELFAYLLGMMVGDSAKNGGEQKRYASMNLDLQLTLRQPTNERLGEFVIMCANSLGLQMTRIKDKQPTGRQLLGVNPSPAYRWSTERSPLLAWVFSTCLGLGWKETTTTHQLHMNWIFATPRSFRLRFVQGAADSDGCAKSVVEIASVPNAQFFVDILKSMGLNSAHLGYDSGKPLKTVLSRSDAATLPIFNEFVKSYRYHRLIGSD